MTPVIKEIAQLLSLDQDGELSSLKSVSNNAVQNIARSYPGISSQYLEFIRTVGTGTTTQGFHIYEPESASAVEQSASFQLYQSKAYRDAFGQKPLGDPIPADALMIADAGMSWRYCLCPSMGHAVFCLDMGGPLFETEAEDFFSFVAITIIQSETKA